MKHLNKILKALFFTAFIFIYYIVNAGDTYTVTKLEDDGTAGTLRYAIGYVKDNSNYDRIEFDIDELVYGPPPHIIYLDQEHNGTGVTLPDIDFPLTIYGGESSNTEEPSIQINGNNLVDRAFRIYQSEEAPVVIENICIRSFTDLGIFVFGGSDPNLNILIKSCVIYNDNSNYSITGIMILDAYNVRVFDCYIGTDKSFTEGLYIGLGVDIESSENCQIGDIENKNIICNASIHGVQVSNNNTSSIISCNQIINCNKAIYNPYNNLPYIQSYSEAGILSGTSDAGDVIEVFGSTCPECANELLGYTTTGSNGEWSILLPENIEYDYCVATSTPTNSYEGTSELTDQFPLIMQPITTNEWVVKITDDPSAAVCANYLDDETVDGVSFSLRWVLMNIEASESTEKHVVRFEIEDPDQGQPPHIIELNEPLDPITKAVSIRGDTEPDFEYGYPVVIIKGFNENLMSFEADPGVISSIVSIDFRMHMDSYSQVVDGTVYSNVKVDNCRVDFSKCLFSINTLKPGSHWNGIYVVNNGIATVNFCDFFDNDINSDDYLTVGVFAESSRVRIRNNLINIGTTGRNSNSADRSTFQNLITGIEFYNCSEGVIYNSDFLLKKQNSNYTVRGVNINNSSNIVLGSWRRNTFDFLDPDNIGTGSSIGIDISDGSVSNWVSIGLFSNVGTAIELNTTGNNAKAAPAITNVGTSTISGTSTDEGDRIEVYTSSTNQETLTYLGSCTTQSDGTWILEDVIYNNATGFVATATDMENNTSELSSYYSTIPSNNIWHVDILGSDAGDGTISSPFRTVQHAIDVSIDNDIVLVHEGTFVENIDLSEKFIHITSYYPFDTDNNRQIIENTVLKSAVSNTPVITIDNTTTPDAGEEIRISGLTIKNAQNPYGNGGGISIINGNNPVLEDLIISNNHAENGGGVYCYQDSELHLIRCEVHNNYAENEGGGIYKYMNSTAGVAEAFIESSLIYRNDADIGGGIYFAKASPLVNVTMHLINTTIASNTAVSDGAGVYGSYSYVEILNSIIYFNTGCDNLYLISCSPTISYSCIENGSSYSGTNCLYTDPYFADVTNDNYRLSPCESPCIEAGIVDGSAEYDILKYTRPLPYGTDPDMGCYEYIFFTTYGPNVYFTGISAEYCSHSEAVTFTGHPEGGWFTGEGMTNNVFNPGLVTSTGTIDITYHYIDEFGCEYSSVRSTIVHQVDFDIKFINPDCATPKSGKIWVEVNEGSGSYSYEWTTINGYFPSGQKYSYMLDPISEGTYLLEFNDVGYGVCEPINVFTYVPTAKVELEVENTGTCGATTADVVVNASTNVSIWSPSTTNYTFEWYKNTDTPSLLFTDTQVESSTYTLIPGDYFVIVTDNDYMCSETVYFTVYNTEPLVITYTTTDCSCYGGSDGHAVAFASGGISGDPGAPNTYNYYWYNSNGDLVSTLSSAYGLAADDYTLFVIINGCIESVTLTINEPNALEFQTTGVVLSGCSATAYGQGGTTPYYFYWEKMNSNSEWKHYASTYTSAGVYSSTIYGLGEGEYRVSFTDARNCDRSDYEYFTVDYSSISKSYIISYRFTGEYKEHEPEEIATIDAPDFNVRSMAMVLNSEVASCRANVEGEGIEMFEDGCQNVFTEDELTLDYNTTLYHYTLYYYDRAGNLVRTVPPAGVTINPTNIDDHSMVTTYNYSSAGELVSQVTPDGGETDFWYNNIGQLRFSKNAVQLASTKFTYTKYDELGRIIEVGESFTNKVLAEQVEEADFPDENNSQQVYTVYSTPGDIDYYGQSQRFLQNRVSYTYNADGVYTYYSYDPHGNVEWIVQDLPGFGKSFISYQYDLISGNVLQVNYNTLFEDDNFFHKYKYDDDNRLVLVESSRDGVIWDKDAGYDYYRHGPLKRVNLGEDKIQGVDYVYTLQGWLKAINNPLMTSSDDPGQDNLSGGENENFPPDAFGMSLGYYDGDYLTYNNYYESANAYMNNNLYNGNISSWTKNTFTTTGFNSYVEFDNEQMGFQYTYDQLNRIKSSEMALYQSGAWQPFVDDYATSYIYDPNGNITNLVRNSYGTAGQNEIDNLAYDYGLGTNILREVKDNTTGTLDGTREDIQGTTSYAYDDLGNLTSSSTKVNGIVTESLEISWNLQGKIATISNEVTSTLITYTYDALGNRIRKDVWPGMSDPVEKVSTFYVRDAQGNIMAIYERNITGVVDDYQAVYTIQDHPVYGSDRLGVVNSGDVIGTVDYDAEDDIAYLDRTDVWQNITEDTENLNWILPFKYNTLYLTNHLLFDNLGFDIFEGMSIEAQSYELIKNLSVAEDLDNNLVIQTFTAYNSTTEDHLCSVFDGNGDRLYSNGRISSIADAQSVIMKNPGNDYEYYLITIGLDGNLYYHIIDMDLAASNEILVNSISANNMLFEAESQLGYSFATIERHGIDPVSILYFTMADVSTLTPATELYAMQLTVDGFGEPVLISAFEGDFDAECGEIQVSPDGSKLGVTTVDNNTIIRIVDLADDYMSTTGTADVDLGFDAGDNLSFDFCSDPKYMYISVSSGNLYKYNLASEVLSLLGSTYYGSVRRGADGYTYIALPGVDYVVKILSNTTFDTDRIAIAELGLSTGLLPLQPYKIIVEPRVRNNILASRYINQKSYELKDHLGNVNSVVSDLKTATLTTGGEPEDFGVTLKTITNYYPFGAPLSGRTAFGNDYRFGYQGQEKDDEIAGVGNSINFKYRMYDPRIARFFAIDPLSAKYPELSPYQFASLNPIWMREIEGLEGEETSKPTEKADLSSEDYVNETSKVISWMNQYGKYENGTIPITDVVDFDKLKNTDNFEHSSSQWSNYYISKNENKPKVIIQEKNTSLIRDAYIINYSNLRINYTKDAETNQRYLKLSSKDGKDFSGIVKVVIPSSSQENDNSRSVGVQINFDISDGDQYTLLKNFIATSGGFKVLAEYDDYKIKD